MTQILNYQTKNKKHEETEFDAITKFEYLSKIKINIKILHF